MFRLPPPSSDASQPLLPEGRPIVVTGGAGFIGINLVHRLLSKQHTVIVLDDLSGTGSAENLAWLRAIHGERVCFQQADIRDKTAIEQTVGSAGGVFHLAAQSSVRHSVDDPWRDFEINVVGSLNLLESVRRRRDLAFLVVASTHKVYGPLTDIAITEVSGRYQPVDALTRSRGINEARRLDFVGPLSCSKGSADQYALDYARIFGLPGVVLRFGSTYGPRQLGGEGHGFVVELLTRTMRDEAIHVFGDGKQVRDLLYVDDAVDALLRAASHAKSCSARAYNVGGGPNNALSVLELIGVLEELSGKRPTVAFSETRTGDQRYYVSDTRAFRAATGWEPTTGAQSGLARLYRWLLDLHANESPGLRAANDQNPAPLLEQQKKVAP